MKTPGLMGRYTPPEGKCSYCNKDAVIECENCNKLACLDHYRVASVKNEIYDVCIRCVDEILKKSINV